MLNLTSRLLIPFLALPLLFAGGCVIPDDGRPRGTGDGYIYRHNYRHKPAYNTAPRHHDKGNKPTSRPDYSGKPDQAHPGGKPGAAPGTDSRQQPRRGGDDKGHSAKPSGGKKNERPAAATPRQAENPVKSGVGKGARQTERRSGKSTAGRGSSQEHKSGEEWPTRNKN